MFCVHNEIQHLRKALTKYKYPKFALDKEENSSIVTRKIVTWETTREN